MPLLSQQAVRCPVGGSYYANTFQRKHAYEGYTYHVREREILPKQRYEQQILGKSGVIKEERWKSAAGKGHIQGQKYEEVPKLTPKQSHELKSAQSEPLLKFTWVDRFEKNPNFIVPGNNKTSYKPQWDYTEPKHLVEQVDLSKTKVRPQWFPKNMLDVNLPRVKLYGIDPKYYDEPPVIEMRNEYGAHTAPPRETPAAASRWHSHESWGNPLNHGVFKITQKTIAPADRSTNLPPL